MDKKATSQTVPDYIGHRSRMKNKVLEKGGNSLTEIELLEVLLMYAIPRKDVKPIAKKLMAKFISLRNVLNADPDLLSDIDGVKDSTICLLKTVEASCIQMLSPILKKETYLYDWTAILDFARIHLSHLTTESLIVIYLDNQKRVIKHEITDSRSKTEIEFSPSDIIQKCVAAKASYIILVHNHPSGRPLPSQADLKNTVILSKKLQSLDVVLIDHLIISNNYVYSINNKGPLNYFS